MSDYKDVIVVTMDNVPNRTVKEVCAIVQAGTLQELRESAFNEHRADAIIGLSKQCEPYGVHGDLGMAEVGAVNYRILTRINYIGTAVKLD